MYIGKDTLGIVRVISDEVFESEELEVVEGDVPEDILEAFRSGATVKYDDEGLRVLSEEEFLNLLSVVNAKKD